MLLNTSFNPDVLFQFRGVYPVEQPRDFATIRQKLEHIVGTNAENAEHCRGIRQIDADEHAQFPWMAVPDRPAMDAFLANMASADALIADSLFPYAKEQQRPEEELEALANELKAAIPNYQPRYRPFSSDQSIESQIQAIFSKSTMLGNEMTKESLAINRQRNGDLQNVRTMMAELRVLIAGKKDDEAIDADDVQIEPDPDSSIGPEYDAAKQAYLDAKNDLLKDPAFLEWAQKRGLDLSAGFSFGTTNNVKNTIYGKFNGKWGYFKLDDVSGSWKEGAQAVRDAANALEGIMGVKIKGTGIFGMTLATMLEHYGVKPSNPKKVAEANVAIEALKGASDSLSSNAQTQMLELQQVVSKTNEKYSQWSSLYEKIQTSKQGLIR